MTVEAIEELLTHLKREIASKLSSVNFWGEELDRVLQYQHTTTIPTLISNTRRKFDDADKKLAVAIQRLEVFESLLERAKHAS